LEVHTKSEFLAYQQCTYVCSVTFIKIKTRGIAHEAVF
jgi:hypothetical protein